MSSTHIMIPERYSAATFNKICQAVKRVPFPENHVLELGRTPQRWPDVECSWDTPPLCARAIAAAIGPLMDDEDRLLSIDTTELP